MIRNILVPYDFTSFSELAFSKALEIASKFDSKIILVTVIGPDVDTSGMSFTRAQEMHDELESKAEADLANIKVTKGGKDVDIAIKIIHNPSAVNGIISFSETQDIDLIVMGSHGRSGFKKLVLGSVASAIVTKAQCPVLLVKQPRSSTDNK